jgi:hypothetical protein
MTPAPAEAGKNTKNAAVNKAFLKNTKQLQFIIIIV